MRTNQWKSIYEDIENNSDNELFLENYIHSSTVTFDIGIHSVLDEINEEELKSDFQLRILEIVKKELTYYRSIERAYIDKVNSRRKDPKPIKNAKDLLDSFQTAYRLSLENTVIKSQIEIKKARIDLKTEQYEKRTRKEYVEYKKESYDFLNQNLDAISSILQDVINNFELVYKDRAILSKEERRLQGYKIIWLPLIKLYLGLSSSQDITVEKLKEFSILKFFKELNDDQKDLLWRSLIRDSGRPYGFVFEDAFIELTSDEIFKEFMDSSLKGQRSVGESFVERNVMDVVFSEVSLQEGGSIKVGASLKMRADNTITSPAVGYDMTSSDYIDSKYRAIPKKTRQTMLYLRRNYNALRPNGSFKKFEIDLSLLFGITRFLNEFIDKIKNDKKDYKIFTMFVISRDEVFLVSDILENILKRFQETKNLRSIKGLTVDIKEGRANRTPEQMAELKSLKLDFLNNAEALSESFYKKALSNSQIRSALNALNYQLSLNPVKKAFYKLDLKSFYSKK